ncbi:MAG: hypothetical protein RIM84_17775 [Alphaproteobacteria bacterium]
MRSLWLAAAALALALPAQAQDVLGLKLDGSLGRGGHTRYVPPVSNPLFNETPFITTELRPIWLSQEIPKGFLTGGGHIDIIAAEIRVALTERLGFIASKDGYADLDFNAVLPDDEGFANLSLGLKYAVYSNPEIDGLITIGIEYEPPVGNIDIAGIELQGDGKGLVDLFVSGTRTYGKWGLQGNVGVNLAVDGDEDTSMLHASAHVDYAFTERFYPLVEVNSFTVIDEAKRTPLDFEGTDIVNFGSTGGGTVVTAAAGFRYIVNDHIIAGFAYERPLTERQDLLDWRLYADLVLHF